MFVKTHRFRLTLSMSSNRLCLEEQMNALLFRDVKNISHISNSIETFQLKCLCLISFELIVYSLKKKVFGQFDLI